MYYGSCAKIAIANDNLRSAEAGIDVAAKIPQESIKMLNNSDDLKTNPDKGKHKIPAFNKNEKQ